MGCKVFPFFEPLHRVLSWFCHDSVASLSRRLYVAATSRLRLLYVAVTSLLMKMSLDTLIDLDALLPFGNASDASNFYLLNATQHPLVRLVTAINLYLIPVISCVGLAGGICSFVILLFTTFQFQPCSHYLAVLTISDTSFLAALLLGWLTSLHPDMASNPGYCQVMVYMTYTCSFLSVWYLVLLMVERYIVVCHPLRAPVLCTKRHAWVAIGVVTTFALVLYLHSFFTTDAAAVTTLHPACEQKAPYLHFLALFSYADILITFIVPFTTILVLNTRVILALRSFRRRHQPLPQQPQQYAASNLLLERHVHQAHMCVVSQAQVRATKMLVWVATVFLVLYLPSHALRLYILLRMLTEEPTVYSQELMLAQQICQFFYYINFAVDFFVFSVTSRSFRRSISRLIKRLRHSDY